MAWWPKLSDRHCSWSWTYSNAFHGLSRDESSWVESLKNALGEFLRYHNRMGRCEDLSLGLLRSFRSIWIGEFMTKRQQIETTIDSDATSMFSGVDYTAFSRLRAPGWSTKRLILFRSILHMKSFELDRHWVILPNTRNVIFCTREASIPTSLSHTISSHRPNKIGEKVPETVLPWTLRTVLLIVRVTLHNEFIFLAKRRHRQTLLLSQDNYTSIMSGLMLWCCRSSKIIPDEA